jgi:4-diphosphocytidyl-2-C-methyl-D-erythritol kinase
MAMREAGGPSTFAIEIDKRIPVGGGLGGGSADAAAVLRALNAMRATPLPPDELLSLSASLGSDIPFLAADVPFALAWGRGERLLALPAPPAADVLLAIPTFGVSTADAYGWLADAAPERGRRAALLQPAMLTGWPALKAHTMNDFEPVVERHHPELAVLRGAFTEAGAAIARLAGSGSTVFGIFPDGPDDVERATLERVSSGTRLLDARTLARTAPLETAE